MKHRNAPEERRHRRHVEASLMPWIAALLALAPLSLLFWALWLTSGPF